ncbi:MAG: hypothetical protein ACI9P5_003104 [Saprospiraceae bacterium]|jgi:hypothetical protein
MSSGEQNISVLSTIKIFTLVLITFLFVNSVSSQAATKLQLASETLLFSFSLDEKQNESSEHANDAYVSMTENTLAPDDWEFTCADGKRVDIQTKGIKGLSSYTENFANSSEVDNVVVEIVYKGSDPGTTLIVEDNTGATYIINEIPVSGNSSSLHVYRGQINGSISSILFDNIPLVNSAQSIAFYIERDVSDASATSGVYVSQSGYIITVDTEIPIPTETDDREIKITVPVSEITYDCRELRFIAQARVGTTNVGSSETVVINPSTPSNGCCIEVTEVTAPAVVGNADNILLKVVSPAGNNSSCPPTSTQTGQSFVLAAAIVADVECVDCDNVTDGGTIAEDQLYCGTSYDVQNLTNAFSPSGGTGTLEYIWLTTTDNSLPVSSWDLINGANSSTYNPGVITEDTYYIRCARRSGCTEYDGESNIVTISPQVNLDAGVDVEICIGDAITLTVNASDGTPNYTYDWPFGLGQGNSKTVSPNSTTTYVVTVTDANGCSDTDDVQVSVNPLPTAEGVDGETCEGANGSVSVNTTSGPSPFQFFWNNGQTTQTINGLNPASTTDYSVTVVDANGCSTTAIATLTIIDGANGGIIAGDENNCGGYDGSLITNVVSPSGADCGEVIITDVDCCEEHGDHNHANALALTYAGSVSPTTITVDSEYNGDVTHIVFNNVSYGEVIIIEANDRLGADTYFSIGSTNLVLHTSCSNGGLDAGQGINSNGDLVDNPDPNNLNVLFIIEGVSTPDGCLEGSFSGSDSGITYQWEQMVGNGSWQLISGATELTYNPDYISTTTKFRRKTTNCCGFDYSNVVIKTVSPAIFANAGPDQSVCDGSSVTLTASTGLGSENEGILLVANPESSSNSSIEFAESGSNGPRLDIYIYGQSNPITVYANKIARIESNNSDHNHNDPKVGYSGGEYDRSLLGFDLSGISGSITQANLRLNSVSSGNLEVAVYSILQEWDQNDVTWDESDNNVSWDTPGVFTAGDPLIATQMVNGNGNVTWDVTSLIDVWVNGSNNNGVT